MARRKKGLTSKTISVESGEGGSVCFCVSMHVCVAFWGLLPLQESGGQLHCPSYRDADTMVKLHVCICVCVCVHS